jgi:hypothetical protein
MNALLVIWAFLEVLVDIIQFCKAQFFCAWPCLDLDADIGRYNIIDILSYHYITFSSRNLHFSYCGNKVQMIRPVELEELKRPFQIKWPPNPIIFFNRPPTFDCPENRTDPVHKFLRAFSLCYECWRPPSKIIAAVYINNPKVNNVYFSR